LDNADDHGSYGGALKWQILTAFSSIFRTESSRKTMKKAAPKRRQRNNYVKWQALSCQARCFKDRIVTPPEYPPSFLDPAHFQ